jgi:CBS domain-containing protein
MRTEFPVAQAGDSLLDLERRMRRSGSPLVSLVEGGRFLGLVTLESVRRALRLSPVR